MNWFTCTDPEAMLKLIALKATARQATYLFLAAMERIHHLLTSDALAGLSEMERQWCDGAKDVDHAKIVKGRHSPVREKYKNFFPDRPQITSMERALWWASDVYWKFEDTLYPTAILKTTEVFGMMSVALYIEKTGGTHNDKPNPYSIDWLCPLIRDIFPDPTPRPCPECGGEMGPRQLSSYPAPLAQCRKCFKMGPYWADWIKPPSFAWRTSATVGIARQMHETKDFSAMPILHDALMDAGCEDSHVLNHCKPVIPCFHCGGRGRWADAAGDMDGCEHCNETGDVLNKHYRGCWLIEAIMAIDKA